LPRNSNCASSAGEPAKQAIRFFGGRPAEFTKLKEMALRIAKVEPCPRRRPLMRVRAYVDVRRAATKTQLQTKWTDQ
jgi:hypothetical protein